MGVVSPVSEILLSFKNGQISLSVHPWSSKNLIDRNWLNKFMQVGVNVKCMYTNFSGHGLSGFGDKISFQIRQNFPFGPWTIVHGGQNIESTQNNCASRG